MIGTLYAQMVGWKTVNNCFAITESEL